MRRVEIVHRDATLRLGVSGNLLLCVWTATPELAHVRAMGRAMQPLSAKYREQWGFLDVVASGVPRFTDDVRDEVVRVMRDPRLQGSGVAHVIQLSGLAGITTRAFLSTAMLIARP